MRSDYPPLDIIIIITTVITTNFYILTQPIIWLLVYN